MKKPTEENIKRSCDQEYQTRANIRNAHRSLLEKITFQQKQTILDIAHEHAKVMNMLVDQALAEAGNPNRPFGEKLSDIEQETIQKTISQHNTNTFPEKTPEEATFEEELRLAHEKKAYAKIFDLLYKNPATAKKNKATYPLQSTLHALSQDKNFQKKCIERAQKYIDMNISIFLIFIDLFGELGIIKSETFIQHTSIGNAFIKLLNKCIAISPKNIKKFIDFMKILGLDPILNVNLIIQLKTPHILLAAIDYSVEYYEKIKADYFTNENFDEEIFLAFVQDQLLEKLRSMMRTHPFLYTKVRFQWIKHGLLSEETQETLDNDYQSYQQTAQYKQQIEDCRRDQNLIIKLSRRHIGSEKMRYELEDETIDPIEWKLNDNQNKRNTFVQREKSYLRRFLEKYPGLEDILKKHILVPEN